MVLVAPETVPSPAERSTCRACGADIGWIVLPGHHSRPIDLGTHPLGEYALLRGGIQAINLRDPDVIPREEADKVPGEIRYFDHLRTCPVPSLRTCEAALGNYLLWAEAKLDGDTRRAARFAGDAEREALRQRLLERSHHGE